MSALSFEALVNAMLPQSRLAEAGIKVIVSTLGLISLFNATQILETSAYSWSLTVSLVLILEHHSHLQVYAPAISHLLKNLIRPFRVVLSQTLLLRRWKTYLNYVLANSSLFIPFFSAWILFSSSSPLSIFVFRLHFGLFLPDLPNIVRSQAFSTPSALSLQSLVTLQQTVTGGLATHIGSFYTIVSIIGVLTYRHSGQSPYRLTSEGILIIGRSYMFRGRFPKGQGHG
jgi:hypothetical protein